MEFWVRWNWRRCHSASGKTAWRAAREPAWSSETMKRTPRRPRAIRLSRKARQWTSASDSAADTPSTRQRPSGPMAMAERMLVSAAAKTWRRLQGENQLPKVIRGVTFRDGIEVTDTASQHAA